MTASRPSRIRAAPVRPLGTASTFEVSAFPAPGRGCFGRFSTPWLVLPGVPAMCLPFAGEPLSGRCPSGGRMVRAPEGSDIAGLRDPEFPGRPHAGDAVDHDGGEDEDAH